MAKDRTGDELPEPAPVPEHDADRCSGWLTPHDSDSPELCPYCRDKSRRRRRPVHEWFEPFPSEKAAAAIKRAEEAEREEATTSRGHNVESPVTLTDETGT